MADPYLRWTIGRQPGEISVRWMHGTTPAYVYWGENAQRSLVPVNGQATHTYTTTGAYRIHLWNQTVTQLLGRDQVVIRETRPEVTVTNDPNDPTVVVATAPAELDDTGIIPHFRVHWDYQDNPTDFTDLYGTPGAKVRRALRQGSHQARVIDVGTKWWIAPLVTVPGTDLDITVTAQSRLATMTVAKATPGKELVISWGDTTLPETVVNNRATHTYPSDVDATYLVQVAYTNWFDMPAVRPIEIPGGSS